MRIPLVYIPKTRIKLFLNIDKNYSASRQVISIGCDCHPAYCLQKLHIRQQSFPFDWLNTVPEKGLQYVVDNIDTNFSRFTENIITNKEGNPVAASYPYAEFIHERELNTDKEAQHKMKRRGERFIKALHHEPVDLLFNFPASEIKSEESVNSVVASAQNLSSKIKDSDRICIYIRYDENTDENAVLANNLIQNLKKVKKITVAKYCRNLSKQGIWGNPAEYPALLKSLNIKIAVKFPKIYIR
ncbi:hypothetical protein E0W68_03395 [Flavobacterium salilacus subsp. salilacus]|uniref:DUF1796 family putative cysteine peptidase n=1 Tax=Flavobacterium TaxID=237 RepID=UPI0010758AE6|nr:MULTISPECIES: DUF1796 family putative cysteine peptidase [Flavobacterium]KAF2519406.1 hypothetical protein E0W68_03395 [Flavobacterium salilacus subsp. salilacus]MBE1614702.1 hypothetical protein [Flavobacterium sp. SaA2.13]